MPDAAIISAMLNAPKGEIGLGVFLMVMSYFGYQAIFGARGINSAYGTRDEKHDKIIGLLNNLATTIEAAFRGIERRFDDLEKRDEKFEGNVSDRMRRMEEIGAILKDRNERKERP